MKASDIDDAAFLRAVQREQVANGGGWAMRWDVAEHFPDVPEKVLLAKARRLMRRGFLDGCPCGCRGDYEVVGF